VSSWRITKEEERWLALASRYRKQKQAPIFAARLGGWRSVNFVPRCAFFALGLVVAGATLSICHLLHLGNGALAAGLILIVAAEWLIVSRRLAFAGIEEALEIAGLLMIAFGIVDELRGPSDVSMALLAAAAFTMAGLRLSNPLFTTLGAISLSLALQLAFGRAPFRVYGAGIWAGVFCYAIAWLALGLGARIFRRPSYDRMLNWLVVFMPLAGYMWLHGNRFAALLPLAYGIVAFIAGIQRRTHAPLLASMICMACVAYEFRHAMGLPLEAQLILEGCVALAIAVTLNRFLRQPRAGITSQRLSDGDDRLNLLELAGAAAIAPGARTAPASAPGTSDGRFGGGGASGSY
jgi:hypothetical protein